MQALSAEPPAFLPKPLSDEALQLIAERFAALGEPLRLRLLMALGGGERTVTALTEATGGSTANVSRHLQHLLGAGLVARRKEGNQAFYRVADPRIFSLCEIVCGSLQERLARQATVFGA